MTPGSRLGEAGTTTTTPLGPECVGRTPVADEIARVAADLFSRQGYDATSVREIVEAAAVTKPALYYYFGSKRGLAEELLTRPLESFCGVLEDIVATEPDPLLAGARIIEAHFEFCKKSPSRARLAYAVIFGPSASSLAGMLLPYAGRFDGLWSKLTGRLADAGLIEADPATAQGLTAALRGVVFVHMIDYLYCNRPLPSEPPSGLVDRLVRGFSGRDPSHGKDCGEPHA